MVRKGWIVGVLCSVVVLASLASGVGADAVYVGRTEGERLRPVVDVTTSSARLNEAIAKGEAQVYEYLEPSGEMKQKIDARLKVLGYPEEVIAKTPWPQKEDWLELDIPYDAWNSSKQKDDSSEAGDQGATRLDDEGDMAWDYALSDVSTSTRRKFLLLSSWNWETIPYWTLTDKVSWGWAASTTSGDNLFAYESNSVRNYQYYWGCRGNASCTTLSVRWDRVVDGAPGAGTATQMDILTAFWKNGLDYIVFDMMGDTYIRVSKAKRAGEQGSFASLSKYWHREGSCTNFTITFSEAPTAEVACSFGYSDTTDLSGDADW